MDTNELISELLQALTDDVKSLTKRVEQLPTQSPVDYRANVESLAQAVQELRQQPKPLAATVDLSGITAQLQRIEHNSRQQPAYQLSRYVQVGALASGLMAVLLVISVWLALTWRSERDEYAQAYRQDNWRVRYTKQVNPDYYNYMEAVYAKNPILFMKWTTEQEQADQKRQLARKAAEQVKILSEQANQLEGKSVTKGKKKGHSWNDFIRIMINVILFCRKKINSGN